MKKTLGWRTRLNEYRVTHRSTPFEWGEYDCALRIADEVKAMTGEDPAKELRSKYTTALGSLKTLKTLGYNSLKDFLDKNFKEIRLGDAALGDIALIETPTSTSTATDSIGWAVGLYLGEHVEVLTPESGTVLISASNVKAAYTI